VQRITTVTRQTQAQIRTAQVRQADRSRIFGPDQKEVFFWWKFHHFSYLKRWRCVNSNFVVFRVVTRQASCWGPVRLLHAIYQALSLGFGFGGNN